MKVNTKIQAGAGPIGMNHNQTAKGVQVATNLKAGRRPGRPR